MKIILRQFTMLLALLSAPFLMWGQCASCPATMGDCTLPTCCIANNSSSTVDDCIANGATTVVVRYNASVSSGMDASGIHFCLDGSVRLTFATDVTIDNNTCFTAASNSNGLSTGGIRLVGFDDFSDLNDEIASIPDGMSIPISEIFIALPVELISFTAKASDQGSLLEWITATETDNDHYLLEHSTDGKTFEYMASISAKPNSSQQQEYQFLDRAPKSGINYYRLWQYDIDGTKSNLGLVEVNNSDLNSGSVKITPNPVVVGGRITLNTSDLFAEPDVGFTLVNSVGQTWSLAPENGELHIPSQLSNGLYYLIITQSSERELLPLVLIE